MITMIKRFTAVFISVLMVFSMFGTTVFAETETYYSISYKQNIISGPDKAISGSTVSITVDAPLGKTVDKLIANSRPIDFQHTEGDTYTFLMPNSAVLLSVILVDDYHGVTIYDGIGGEVSADKTEAVEGETVTLTVVPADGYSLSEIKATYTENNEEKELELTTDDDETFTFIMPSEDVAVSVKFQSPFWKQLQEQINSSSSETITLDKDIYANDDDTFLKIPSNVTVTIDLNGHTLSRNLFEASQSGSVFEVYGTLTVTDSSDNAEGKITGANGKSAVSIEEYGSFILNKGSVTGNTTGSMGGGVFVSQNSSFTMNDGNVSENSAKYGGAVYIESGGLYSNRGSFIMNGGMICNNTATNGGGVYLDGSSYYEHTCYFGLKSGSICGNTAVNGGGIYNSQTQWYYGPYAAGDLSVSGGSITGNTAENGGGVYGSINMYNGAIISDNTASMHGAGIYLDFLDRVYMNNSFVTGNHGDGVYHESPEVNYTDSVVLNNSSICNNSGCGLYGVFKKAEIKNSTISGNTAGGAVGSGFSISGNTTIVDNTAGSGDSIRDMDLASYEPITVSDALAETAQIGLSIDLIDSPYGGYVITNGLSGKGTIDNFFLNDPNSGYILGYDNAGELALKRLSGISVLSDEHGSASASAEYAATGETVTLTANPDEGFRLKEWQVISGGITVSNDQFTMPSQDVEVKAVFERVYAVTTDNCVNVFYYDSDNNPVYVTEAGEGDELWVEIKENAVPESGNYFTGEFSVNGTSLGYSGSEPWIIYNNSFTMPAEAVDIAALQESKTPIILNLSEDTPCNLPFEADVKLNVDDRISISYDENDYSTLLDLDGSGTPDVKLYESEEVNGAGETIAINSFVLLLPEADATGSFKYDYPGNRESFSSIVFVMPEFLFGDADGNGIVSVKDVTAIQRHIAEFETMEDYQLRAADIDRDGVVTIDDATEIQRFLAEYDNLLQIGEITSITA